jgi:hypothetical protein
MLGAWSRGISSSTEQYKHARSLSNPKDSQGELIIFRAGLTTIVSIRLLKEEGAAKATETTIPNSRSIVRDKGLKEK